MLFGIPTWFCLWLGLPDYHVNYSYFFWVSLVSHNLHYPPTVCSLGRTAPIQMSEPQDVDMTDYKRWVLDVDGRLFFWIGNWGASQSIVGNPTNQAVERDDTGGLNEQEPEVDHDILTTVNMSFHGTPGSCQVPLDDHSLYCQHLFWKIREPCWK